ncbi:MAG: ParB/RepB/Spo0J family partition protein [Burkholderiaceae bacterium]
MSDAEFEELKADIQEHGQREPIITVESKILDGRHRYRACLELGREPKTKSWIGNESEMRALVVSQNLKRRHLNEGQRSMVAASMANLRRGDNSNPPIGGTSQSDAAEALNVSLRGVQRAQTVIKNGSDNLQKAVGDGGISVSAAAEIAKLPAVQQNSALASRAIAKARDKPPKAPPADTAIERLIAIIQEIAVLADRDQFSDVQRKRVATLMRDMSAQIEPATT